MVSGLHHIESKMPEGESLTDSRWRERVLQAGYERLLQAAGSAAAYHARGGAKVWADGMLKEMNKGRRIRLEIGTV